MKNQKNSFKEKSIAIGILCGTMVGLLTKNLGLWLSLGVAFGAAVGYSKSKPQNDKP
jgi:hypothetical protein